ncbi:MAG: MBL fold metallo-hydrolase [Nanoarchaeota archaeon]|nr:MBL fold metallo-hydrolase [Nanoarchaeota archaeon]
MKASALASGSSGNCFFIEDKRDSILVDAGISTKQIILRLGLIGKNPENIKAIFITHEHSDHIRGADYLARKFNIPIFATKKTIENCDICSNEDLINPINNNESVDIGRMRIEAFSKSHRAFDPVSYNISNGNKISIITDIGYACPNVISNVSDSDMLFLESNHDVDILENGHYPYFLKKWIKSDIGHISNIDAANCVLENARSRLKYLVLSHLSENNNTPQVALDSFSVLRKRNRFNPRIFISDRYCPTELFNI